MGADLGWPEVPNIDLARSPLVSLARFLIHLAALVFLPKPR